MSKKISDILKPKTKEEIDLLILNKLGNVYEFSITDLLSKLSQENGRLSRAGYAYQILQKISKNEEIRNEINIASIEVFKEQLSNYKI